MTKAHLDAIFERLLGMPARNVDLAAIEMMGGTAETIGDYLWDHWMGEPRTPTRGKVIREVEKVMKEFKDANQS